MQQPPAGVGPLSLSDQVLRNHLGQPIGLPLDDWSPPDALASDTLSGVHVRLERLRKDHTSDLFEVFGEDQAGDGWTYLPYGPFASESDLLDWALEFINSPDPWMYAVVDIVSNKVRGVASYLRITPSSGSAEVGHIHFSKSLKHTRAATEAMYLMAKHVFDVGYRRYEWKCDALNAPSRRAAERFGFTFEGIFRQATVYKNRNRDTAWFAMLDSEWPAIADAYERWLHEDNFDADGKQRHFYTLGSAMIAHREI